MHRLKNIQKGHKKHTFLKWLGHHFAEMKKEQWVRIVQINIILVDDFMQRHVCVNLHLTGWCKSAFKGRSWQKALKEKLVASHFSETEGNRGLHTSHEQKQRTEL